MDEYEIILTPDAEEDLWELRNYIAGVLFSPDTALEYIRAIQKRLEASCNSRRASSQWTTSLGTPAASEDSLQKTSMCTTGSTNRESVYL